MKSRLYTLSVRTFISVISLSFLIVSVSGCIKMQPKTPENLCGIFEEKRSWYRAAQKSRDRWKSPIGITMSFIYQESGYDAYSKPEREKIFGIIPSWKRKSSAEGYAQAIDATWEQYVKEAGGRFSNRSDFKDAVDFVGWYNAKSQRHLGISRTNAKALYLAYHEGWRGYQNKTYRKKGWLIDAAERVEKRARNYQIQYQNCKHTLSKWYDFIFIAQQTKEYTTTLIKYQYSIA